MHNKSFFDTLGDVFCFVIFIKYVLPILVIFLLLVAGYQYIYGINIRGQYKDKDNVIFITKFEDTIYENAESVYNSDVFYKIDNHELLDDPINHLYSVEVNYYFKDPDKTVEEYDALVKNEVTNLYNSLKDKKVVADNSFAANRYISKSIGMVFYYPEGDDYDILCSAILKYTEETGFDEETYQKLMGSTIVTEERLDFVLNH